MKKSLNLVFLICLFLNVATVGQNAQRSQLIAMENRNMPSSQFVNFSNTEGARFDKKVKTFTTATDKGLANRKSYKFQDFPSLLDKKSSLERAISLKEIPQNRLGSIYTIDGRNDEPNNIDLRITTPLQFTIDRKYTSFGPVYQF